MNGIMIDPATGELAVKNGTLQVGNADEQHIEAVTLANKGEFKEFPVMGVGIVNYVKSTGKEKELVRQVKIQLAILGYKAVKVEYKEGKLLIRN